MLNVNKLKILSLDAGAYMSKFTNDIKDQRLSSLK